MRRDQKHAEPLLNRALVALVLIICPMLAIGYGQALAEAPQTEVSTSGEHRHRVRAFFRRHPRIKKAAKAAAIGACIGSGVGLVIGAPVVVAGALGAGKGAAISGVRTSKTWQKMKDKMHRHHEQQIAQKSEKKNNPKEKNL